MIVFSQVTEIFVEISILIWPSKALWFMVSFIPYALKYQVQLTFRKNGRSYLRRSSTFSQWSRVEALLGVLPRPLEVPPPGAAEVGQFVTPPPATLPPPPPPPTVHLLGAGQNRDTGPLLDDTLGWGWWGCCQVSSFCTKFWRKFSTLQFIIWTTLVVTLILVGKMNITEWKWHIK